MRTRSGQQRPAGPGAGLAAVAVWRAGPGLRGQCRYPHAQALADHVAPCWAGGDAGDFCRAHAPRPRKVAWCTGGAQGYFEAAIAAGADVFITGEISEPQAHLAREMGVAFIAAGHHATERYGAPAVAG
jgi:putative NIF3 family GTP cyclohydrolase 1 type 2